MGRADTVGPGVATADDKHVLTLGIDKLVLGKLLSGKHTVLLTEHLKREINAFQLSSGDFQVAGLRCSGADDHGVEVL